MRLGSHKNIGRRGQSHGSRETDGSLSYPEPKTSKRGSVGYGSHEVCYAVEIIDIARIIRLVYRLFDCGYGTISAEASMGAEVGFWFLTFVR